MENLSGQIVKGYELRERIGAGGFGAVYRAHQTTVGREVAMKIILPGFANQPDFVRRFEVEAQIIARLEHLHIVPLYDYWREPDGAYLIMRWLRGGSLRDALQRNGAYDLENAALILDQIASALSAAHQHNVIHRDLKPGNILLDEDGNAYLADFGIAKDLSALKEGTTQVDAIVGSPDYLSPEQARSEPVTPQTDIYSLGVVLHEILTGQHPFPNLSSIERLYKHLNDPLPLLDRFEPDVCERVNAVVQKATAKNPAHRYADAPAMALAFREAIALNAQSAPAHIVEVLTPREQEILQYIIEGRSNKEIAAQLFVTVATIKWYITQIYQKLGVRSRVQAIVRARELNLISKGFTSTANDSVVGVTHIPTDQFLPENPYKGLHSFETIDYRDFFGREKLTEKLIKRLGETGEMARFLAVIGPSGSGKSSVVKAGLIPALWRGDLPKSEKWFVVEMMPGARPLDELEVALTRVATMPTTNLYDHLQRDQYGLLRAASLILPNEGSELVLVIDQFEEIFTLVEDEKSRAHFLNLLYAAVMEPRSRLRVVVTLRADFYDRPLHYPDFGELIRNRMETVLPLGAKGIERAILGPSERVGISFEDGLVAAIVEEMHYQVGALPLLQYALTELFERRQGRMITHMAYQEMGGAVGALAKRADDLYREFKPDGQEAIRQMFLRLVIPGEGSENTRRRVPRSELMALVADNELIDEIIDTFVAYRLLSLDNDPVTHSPTVEVAHEAILREWERLRLWLEESRNEIVLQRQLNHAAQEWNDSARDTSFLLRGARLGQFETWVASTQLALTQQEREFVQSSIANRVTEQTVEQERQAREIRLEQRSRNFLRSLVVVLLLATIGAFILSAFAINQSNTANRNAAVSQSLALASAAQAALTQGNTDQALALSVVSNQIDAPPAFAQRLLYESAFSPGTIRRRPCTTQWCWVVDVSPDEQTILTGDGNGGIILSDLTTGQPIRRFESGHTEEASAFFLADGQRILSIGYDDRIVLWNIASGEIIHVYESPYGDVNSADVSPDGRLIATGTEGGIVIIWDIETGEMLHQLIGHETSVQVQGVEFSPDGRTLLSASEDTTMILWDVQTEELLHRFEGHTNAVFRVRFSPDGQSALSTSLDNTMILWDIDTGQIIRRFIGHTNWVFDARFTADGTRILSASRDGTLILWDVATGNMLHTYGGESGIALSVHFLENDAQAISSHNTGYLRVWQLDAQNIVRQFGETAQPVGNEALDDSLNSDGDLIAFSSDGRLAAAPGSGVDADEILLWNVETGELVRHFTGHEGNVTSIMFSPDQSQLVSASWDNTLILWNVTTGEQIHRFIGHSGAVFDVSFNPDGNQLVSGSEDRTMILWDVETNTVLRRFEGFTDSVNTVAFSPDGHTVLAGMGTIRYVAGNYEDSSLRLFNAATGEEIRRFEGHTAPVTVAAFSADGSAILSGSTDATVRLWDVAGGEEIRRFTGQVTSIWSVNYSADERYIAAGSQDGTIIVWNATTGDIMRQFSGNAAMIYGIEFTLSGDYLLSADASGVLNMWRLSLDLNSLLTWTHSNRYVRDLSCSEQELYQLSQSCSEISNS
jgi:WD40 repeat protein/serine/threonine protein kinase